MKKLYFFLVIIIVFSFSLCNAKTFTDLTPAHWSYKAVNSMAEVAILNGYPDGSFKPNNPVSFAEFSKILVVFYRLDDSSSQALTTLPSNHWANEYIKRVTKYWTNSDSYSKVDSPVLREDVISTIIKVRGFDKSKYSTHDFINLYDDRNEIREDLWDYIEVALEDKVVQGDQRKLNPKGNLTRAEVCQIFYNLCNIDGIDLKNRSNSYAKKDTENSIQSFANLAERHSYASAAYVGDVGTVYIGMAFGDTYPVYYRMNGIYLDEKASEIVKKYNSSKPLVPYDVEDNTKLYCIEFDVDLKDFQSYSGQTQSLSPTQFMRSPSAIITNDESGQMYRGKGTFIPADTSKLFYNTGDITKMYCVLQVPKEIVFSDVMLEFLCDNDLNYETFFIKFNDENKSSNTGTSVNKNDNVVTSDNMKINKFDGVYTNKANETLKYTGWVSFHEGRDNNYFSVFTCNENNIKQFIPDFFGKVNNRYLIQFMDSEQTVDYDYEPGCEFVLVCSDTTGSHDYVIDKYDLSEDRTYLKSLVRGEQYNFYKSKESYDLAEYINDTYDFNNTINGIYNEQGKEIEILGVENQELGASNSVMVYSNDSASYYWKENLSDNSIPFVLSLYLKEKDSSSIKEVYTNRFYANYCSGIIVYQDGSLEKFSIQMSKTEVGKVQVDSETKLTKKGNIEKPIDNMKFLDKWNYQVILNSDSYSKIK